MFPVADIRALFPALSLTDNDVSRVCLDNPAGTQVPKSVAGAIANYMLTNASNMGGHFTTSLNTDAVTLKAHEDIALFLGAKSSAEVIIGQSMTSLTFHLSRSICRDFQPGDEIIVSRVEHEGNIGPWLEIAKDKGLNIRWVDFDRETWLIEPENLAAVLTDKTRLVCLNFASNMTGSINDIAALTRLAHDAGAQVFVDAVQLAPHHLVDVQALGCDYLVCSSYKFFGPHLGILWGKEEVLAALHPYKGRCVSDALPDRFEAGTPQFELLAGLSATVQYFEDLGSRTGAEGSRRALIAAAYQQSRDYEEPLTNTLIDGLGNIAGIKIFGITNPNRVHQRVPTISIRHDKVMPGVIAKALADAGIYVWHGHNYAYEPTRFLNIPEEEGVVRVGLAHYNTNEEVTRVVEAVDAATRGLQVNSK
ncbi:cysteine desulfurase-like protein [Candidatus Halocynthiibacter alkanivorans]|uniref:cysteine desulfurase-like protein n=1 Tax=Candidatus Halocynthiibacter alkanivorans TaxID=2267619 RepID=UPI001F472EB7|nr:cysteine desulfurase-like protein [Candidatus Halocynthiibacter alkanivorans]